MANKIEKVAETAAGLMALFLGLQSAHGTHGEPTQEPGELKWAIKSTAKTLRQPVTVALWEAHVRGERPLGIIPIREDNTCGWGSIDVDEYEEDLLALVAKVAKEKLPLVPCRSKSGGLHLFIFLEEPQPAAAVLAVLRDMAAGLGLAGSEIFPKQAQVLLERGDLANWMVMPYYGDTYGGKIREQVGLRPTGAEMTAQEFLRAAERTKVTAEAFAGLSTRRTAARRGPRSAAAFDDGPPCLQHLAEIGIQKGGQSNALLMMGIYYKRANPEDWEHRLEEANRTILKPPGTSEGLQTVMRSLKKKDYEYTCRTEPMASHCNSAVCRSRRWGVGEEGNYPNITGLSKLDQEPPIWFVDVGDQRLEVATDVLQNYSKFHLLCMERLSITYRLMKQDAWLQVVSDVMKNVTLVPAAPDAGESERFRELLEEFLTNRQAGTAKEDLLSGRPWLDEGQGRHYFRMADLQKFLAREGVKDDWTRRGLLTRRIARLDGDHAAFNVKGKYVNVWWVPAGAVHKSPQVPLPPVPGVPV